MLPQHALAQMPGGSTELTQLANKLLLGQQLATQAQQIQNMLLNTKGLTDPSQIWGTAMQDISSLNSLLQQGKSLAFSAGNLDGQFASQYGTYDSYLAQKMGTSDWKNKYEQWSQEASDNALNTLKGLGLQSSQMQNENSQLQQLQSMAGTATGHMQALQVANMMAAQTVDQIQKLRELIMMQSQMQANYLATQQDQDAAWKAQRDNLLQTWKPTPDTDGKVYGTIP
jgi:P-type conjugative transfer protein TrbJ